MPIEQYAELFFQRIARKLPETKTSYLRSIRWFDRTAYIYFRCKADVKRAADFELQKFKFTVDVKSKY